MEGRNEQPVPTLDNLRLQRNIPGFNISGFNFEDPNHVQNGPDNDLGPLNVRPDFLNRPNPTNCIDVEGLNQEGPNINVNKRGVLDSSEMGRDPSSSGGKIVGQLSKLNTIECEHKGPREKRMGVHPLWWIWNQAKSNRVWAQLTWRIFTWSESILG